MKALTSTQRARLKRLRERGEVTAETPYDKIIEAVTNYKRKPMERRLKHKSPITQTFRMRLKRKYGITPTQLLQYSKERQSEIMKQCATELDGRTLKARRIKEQRQT